MRHVGSLVAVLGGVCVAALAPALHADEPATSATAPAPSASAPPSHRDEQLQRRLERLQQRARELASALPLGSAVPLPSGSALPPELASALPQGLALGQELARRWAERGASRLARREQHRAELSQELGQSATDPRVLAELQLHAQRVSDLSRAEFLARNARSGKQRDQLLGRVGKLLEREASRHHKKLASLVGSAKVAPAPSASGAPAP